LQTGRTLFSRLPSFHSLGAVNKQGSDTAVQNDAGAACLHKVFEEQARRTPEAIALSFGEKNLTYAQLNARANQLARQLRKLGVKPQSPVALCLERSLDMVVAIVGVLKAGGTYVPVDLAYPADRLAFMLEDTQAPVLLTQKALVPSLPPHKAQVICLDTEWETMARESGENLPNETQGDHAAYIIFTSGSTGKPKGVLVTHHNVVRLFTQTEQWYGFNERDVWTLFHSYAFDFSVWEIWGALLYGGRLVVVPYLISRSPSAFYELLGHEKVTVLNQTPSAFRQLIWAEASAETKQNLSLRYVIFGGEALQLASLEPWFERHGDEKPLLVNMYGITETTVHVTYRPIRRADVEAGLGSVIGVPIPDLELCLLDEKLQPVPLGCGYLKRPELTAEKFIANPSGKGRLYRSGDLARFLPGGELEYLGRKDHQVKIRGFRIELGEIESVLQQHAGVRECVVVAKTDGEQARLIGYVVGKASVSELRQWLGEKVPDYMIPAAFVFLDALPITLNGKTDLKALPEPDRARPELTQEYVAPATREEILLADIWREVLAIDRVGRNDNFFELGGDSIRSIQVLSRAQARGLRFSLQQLFEHPTLFELTRLTDSKTEDTLKDVKPFALVSPHDRPKLPGGLEDAYPMAKLQVGMIFHSDYDPASAIFHDVFSFRLQMPFDETVFRKAAQRLMGRHTIFRTAFNLGNYSEPLQLVHASVEVPITVEDLQGMAADDQRQRLVNWVEHEKRNRFDWNVPPMMRLHVQQYTKEVFQCVVSFHHTIMDGWSLAAMLTELFQDYANLLKKSAEEITAPKVTYRDFVILEREAMASEEVRNFWRKKLANATSQLLPRWPKAMRKGGLEQTRGPEIIFPPEILDGLKRLGHSLRVPFRTVLLAAHCRVMGFLTGQTDVLTGLVTNGRPQTIDGERLIGLFLNTLPLRMATSGGTWKELIKQTFEAEKEIIPNRRCPLSEVQQLGGGQALYETAFDFVQFHVYRDLPGYGNHTFLEDYYFEANNFNFYATFMLNAEASELQMHFDYNPNEFCEEQIRLMCDYYGNALRTMALSPDARYETASLLPPEEKKRLIEEWNATDMDYPDVCVHQLFEEQAAKTPDAPAVTFEDTTLTYHQLDTVANRLAARLREEGIGPDGLAGIHCERSMEMLIGVLAVLKAGGAYLPLDPAYPQERLEFMKQDAGLKVILTREKIRAAIAGDSATAAIKSGVAPENLAYMIYTSGSTGQPKGVQVPHRAVVNFLASMKKTPGLTSQDVLIAVTTLSFDIAGLELLLPLTVGARVVIARAETAVDFPALAELMRSSGATVMQATPTTWRGLIESGWADGNNLKALCGGEAFPRDLAEKLLPRCKELWNMYGPTETTIWSSVERVTSGEGAVPIGRPIANTQFYVLDAQRLPVPTGAMGEVFIGGDGVTRGYFKRTALTSEKFLPNPFRSESNARIYNTGDTGYYLPDGTLMCAGRVDQQVKLRGFRIELGEIETVLGRHPSVASSVAAVKADPSGGQRLVAYWVSRNGVSIPASELRGFLSQHLPAHMVPSSYVHLQQLPLTPNGKIDRKRLPEPDSARPEMDKAFAAPRTPIEEALATAWSDVLKIEPIGIHDNFFALGGHSLSAMQVIARLRNDLDVPITVASFFEHPTIEEFALEIMAQLYDEDVKTTGDRMALTSG
jgi:amino acid adenylation domain-containing protein